MPTSPQEAGETRDSPKSGGWILFVFVWVLIATNIGVECLAPKSVRSSGNRSISATSIVSMVIHRVQGFCERTVPFCMLVLTALTTAGCGGRILQSWHFRSARSLEFLALSSALGWAVLSLPLCLLAAVGQFSPPSFVPIALACSLLFGMGTDGRLSGWLIWRSVPWLRLGSPFHRSVITQVAGVVTLVVIFITFLWACGPVWDYDSEMYHLPNAAKLLLQRGLVVSHDEPLANLPGQAYLWFALGLAANAEAYPALLVWWATVMTSLLAACLAGRWFGVRAALWTIPIFWSALIVHAVASTPRVEPLYSFLFLAAVSWLLEAHQRRQLGWAAAISCGICLGTAASIKVQGLYGWPLIGIWWGWLWISQRTFRTPGTLVRVTCLFLVALSVMSPWWVKNYRAFGNPIHPMFSQALDRNSLRNANPYGPTNQTRPWYFWGRDTLDLFVRPNTFSGPPGQWPHYVFLLLPLLTLTRMAQPRKAAHLESTGQLRVTPEVPPLNPPAESAKMIALPRAMFRSNATSATPDVPSDERPIPIRFPRPFRCSLILSSLAAGYYLTSLTLTHESRHQFGMFSLASILVAHIVSQMQVRWKMDVLVPVIICSLLAFVVVFPGRVTRFPKLVSYLAGLIDSNAMRESVVPSNYLRVCRWCNENLPENAVVLLCWESRIYRLHRPAIADSGACTWSTLFRHRSTPAEISAYLHQQGIAYVLVNESSIVYNVERSKLIAPELYSEFRDQRNRLVPDVLEPVFEFPPKSPKTVSVYRVR